ncbi:MAG: plastocyanin/azurin family copper-binding protein [Solirubrobacterales bacterium]
MKKLAVLFALLALIPFAFAACGDDEEESTSAETTEETTAEDTGGDTGGGAVAVSAVADGSFAFEQTELTATAGPTTFEFENPASLGHDFCLEQDGSEVGCSDLVSEDSSTLEADLETGEYTFYCSVAGHREGGMEGTVTVE